MKQTLFALFLLVNVATTRADIILAWNTFGNAGTETTEASTVNFGVSASNLTLGAGVNAAGNANRFGGNNWFDTGNANPSTLANAIAGNNYIEFTVTPDAGKSIDLTSLSFVWDRSNTGPSSVALRSSADGFSTDLGSATGIVNGALATQNFAFSLTNIITPTTFRMYGFNATGTTGTGGFDTATNANNVILNGSVTVPEPGTLILAGLLR